MKYYKLIDGDYILLIMVTDYHPAAIEISEQEYNTLLTTIRTAPLAPNGYTYMLRADTLEWELVELPPEPEPEPDADISDYEQQLAGLGVRFE